MIEYLIFGAIFLFSIYIFHRIRKARQELLDWDPFGWNTEMTTELICDKCGYKKVREWDDRDFVFAKTKDKCPCVCKKQKCKGPMVVRGIYLVKEKTKEELKWEKIEAQWR